MFYVIIIVFMALFVATVFYAQHAFIERQYNMGKIIKENEKINEAMMSRKIYNQETPAQRLKKHLDENGEEYYKEIVRKNEDNKKNH